MIDNPDLPRVIRRDTAYEQAYKRLCDDHDDEDYEPTGDEIDNEVASQAASEADHAYDQMRDRQWDERLGQ